MNKIRLLKRLRARVAEDPQSVNVGERLLATVRGAVAPLVLKASGPHDYDLRRTLVVAGFPRSGTTWLAEVLADVPGTGLVFEPLDLRRVHAARDAGFDWENFVPAGTDWPSGEAFMRKVLSGQVQTRWTASQLPLRRAFGVQRWLVKFVRANQLLAWMVDRFPLPPPVLLVRHPCAVYDSWTRRGWPIAQEGPRQTLRFFQAYPELYEITKTLRTPEEYFAAEWAIQHYAPLKQLKGGTYQLCLYERLRADGVYAVEEILNRWNLSFPEGLERRLARPSAKASGQASHERGGHRSGWRDRLDSGVVKKMMRVVRAFGIDLYETEP